MLSGWSPDAGVDEVGRAVTMLDTMTQQNAALSEQSTAAATSLSHQAARLRDVVNAFRLTAGGNVRDTLASRAKFAAIGSGRRGLLE